MIKTTLGVLLSASTVSCFSAAEKQETSKPNFVYFFCDDLGIGDVGCYNPNSQIQTPNIDKLAAGGMVFTDAHVSAAMCTPSRYNLMTGQYRWRSPMGSGMIWSYGPPLFPKERLSVAQMLHNNGYHTDMVGKWNLGMDWTFKNPVAPHALHHYKDESNIDFSQTLTNGPCDRGFDTFFGMTGSLDMGPYLFIKDRHVQGIPSEKYPSGRNEARATAARGVPGWKHEDVLPTLRDKAISVIQDNVKNQKPFFLYLPITAPHTPVTPSKAFIGKSGCGIYGDFVMEVDDAVGKIVQSLKDSGVWENTVFIFSSDNGPEFIVRKYPKMYGHSSTAEYRGIKRDNWEGGHRVPMIVSWPAKVQAGTTCMQVTEIGDFMATAADIISQTLPDNAAEDSFSFLPYLLGKQEKCVRPYSITEAYSNGMAIRKGEWKLILHSGSGGDHYDCPENKDPIQLFNMKTDPCEKHNVYTQHPDIVNTLCDLYIQSVRDGRSSDGKPQPTQDLSKYSYFQNILKMKQNAFKTSGKGKS